jgi:hypothetical protein
VIALLKRPPQSGLAWEQEHDEQETAESLAGAQGQGGAGRRAGRQDAGGTGRHPAESGVGDCRTYIPMRRGFV